MIRSAFDDEILKLRKSSTTQEPEQHDSVDGSRNIVWLHPQVASQDHKLVYWFAGGLAALFVLLEKKGRRGELGLYVLPRAGESLWYIFVNRHVLPDIKNAELSVALVLCLCKIKKSVGLLKHSDATPNPPHRDATFGYTVAGLGLCPASGACTALWSHS
ncbi:hypothetical protein L2E82_05150 [Cichorium intybus]|uniref:Uncharacterized protein n=1 Tax=Cichorium intybus TaxID=13427 RepID=A0ACB9H8V5_CICIN|nr:hypothetical protein L2E82_05150 [Cichorium intybus]